MSRYHELNELLPSTTSSAYASSTNIWISNRAEQTLIQPPVPLLSSDTKLKRPTSRSKIARWTSLTETYWIYELTSCLLAVSALASIIGVLARFDGRAIPQWPDLISINTLIAVLTAILKASLLLPVTEGISELKWSWFQRSRPLIDFSAYDSASRGPWGSFLFLVTRKPQFLASLGAFITVCALAIDPFSQQVIKYQNCLEPTTLNIAQVARSNNYSTAGIHIGAGETGLDGPMTIAIYNGLLNPASNPSSLISIQCSSGNCTFPSNNGASYSSLAMCHDVQDISQYIQNKTNSTRNYVLPSGPELSGPTMLSTIIPETTATASESPPQPLANALFTFETLMYTCTVGSAADCPLPFAFRASIYPCVKTYGGNISQSTLTETTISSVPLTWNSRESLTLVTNTTIRDGSLSDCRTGDGSRTSTYSVPVYGESPTFSNLYVNAPDIAFITTSLPNNTVQWYAPDCTYSVNSGSVQGITQFLNGFFGNNTLGSPYGLYDDVAGDLWLTNLYMNATANMSTVDKYMQGLTDSMTAVIRARGDTASPGYTNYASGTVYESQTCIHVRWVWLALPAALVLAGVGFLLATIVLTSAQRLNPSNFGSETHGHFKSSPLALLFHGIEPRTLQTLQQPRDVAGMEALAENLNVTRLAESMDSRRYLVADRMNDQEPF